jgi:hypothetical protein
MDFKKDAGSGVPEALPRTLAFVRDRLGTARIDRLWIFPPLVRGRRERGLLVATCFTGDDRRAVHTVTYSAERTGMTLEIEPTITEEGLSPDDRVPRLILGVVTRSELDLGQPREIAIEGTPGRFEELLGEFDPALFEEVGA